MAKYSKAAGKKVETVMKEMEKGTLKTGSGILNFLKNTPGWMGFLRFGT